MDTLIPEVFPRSPAPHVMLLDITSVVLFFDNFLTHHHSHFNISPSCQLQRKMPIVLFNVTVPAKLAKAVSNKQIKGQSADDGGTSAKSVQSTITLVAANVRDFVKKSPDCEWVSGTSTKCRLALSLPPLQ